MSKRVRIAIEMDEHFIRMLKANVELSGGMDGPDRQHTPSDALKRLVLAEARGATEAQVHSFIRPEWRPHIEAVSHLREVTEEDSLGPDNKGG
jgi:hypothetical protein